MKSATLFIQLPRQTYQKPVSGENLSVWYNKYGQLPGTLVQWKIALALVKNEIGTLFQV